MDRFPLMIREPTSLQHYISAKKAVSPIRILLDQHTSTSIHKSVQNDHPSRSDLTQCSSTTLKLKNNLLRWIEEIVDGRLVIVASSNVFPESVF